MGKTNFLKALKGAYEAEVKRQDDQHDPEILKRATNEVFEALKKEIKENISEDISFTDIEYSDGYFFFATGSNTVIQFHIPECPGWLFGIWWNCKGDNIKGQLFAQYEANIDKFKPSASPLCQEIQVLWNETSGTSSTITAYEAAWMIQYIIKEPYLAFCRDYYFWDYNREYHTREEAKAAFDQWKKEEEEGES